MWRLPPSWALGLSTAGAQHGRAGESLLQAAWRCLPWPEPSRGRALPWPDHTPPPPPAVGSGTGVCTEPLAQEEGRPCRSWPTPRLTTRTQRPVRISEPFHTESGLGELQSGLGARLLLFPFESEGCPSEAALESESASASVFQCKGNLKSSTKKESENPLPWSLLPHSTRPVTKSINTERPRKSCFALKRNFLSRQSYYSRWFQKTVFKSSKVASEGEFPYPGSFTNNEPDSAVGFARQRRASLSGRCSSNIAMFTEIANNASTSMAV